MLDQLANTSLNLFFCKFGGCHINPLTPGVH